MNQLATTLFASLLVHLTLAAPNVTGSTVSPTPSCVQASENAAILKNLYCNPYNYSKNGYCKDIIKTRDVYGDNQAKMENNLQRIVIGKRMLEGYIPVQVRDSCLEFFNQSFCQYSFPKCDLTSSLPKARSICRETCEDVFKRCDKEMELFRGFNVKRLVDKLDGNDYSYYWDIINCSTLEYRNGGDIPECYFARHLNTETDKLQDSNCYYDNGLGYRGNVSVTRSGHVCQSWSSQCPHRHDHPLSKYPELVNASNWCRNPGGQGPNGPWCYTTNSSIRWEYCDVEKCPPPAPTLAPEITELYSNGPNKVFIKWNPVPLPFIHGQPRGFRVNISEFGEEAIINTTNPNITEFEYKTLQPLTSYNVSVLAFNDAGDGPWSKLAQVETMPKNSVTARYVLNVTFSPPRRPKFKEKRKPKNITSVSFKNSILRLFRGRRLPDGYSIYQMKVVKFDYVGNSAYDVKFDMTAELKGRPSWFAIQNITGRLLRLSQAKFASKGFQINAIKVEAPPPPPANVRKSDVKQTSVTVDWSKPLYNEPYRITNYSVQYRKAGTNLKYYEAANLGPDDETKVNVNNLDAGKKYLMRVVSYNAHGDEASEPMTVKTKDKDNVEVVAIVLPFVAAILFLIIGGFVFVRRKRIQSMEMQEKLQKLRENPYDSAVDWFNVLNVKITKQWWEISRDDLALDDELGSGAFGVVVKGYLTKREEESKDRIVCAVKMLKDNPTERQLRDLCNEINIMSSVGDHPNLVSLIGACTIDGPLWLVVKYAPNGCLLDYLKDNRPTPEYQNTSDLTPNQPRPTVISERERMRFAYEIAQGMAHLERHRYIHRDVAVRNVLLGKNMVAMVSDFGMSRDIYEAGVYENTAGGLLPVRWMALESLQDYTYTSKSDVWSYGVLLWEIESGGLMPYAGMSGTEVVERLREGYRLERPNNTSRDIYEVMWQCWNPDPNKRPTFADLVYSIGGLFNMTVDFEDTETTPDNNKNEFKLESENKTSAGHQSLIEMKKLNFFQQDVDM